MSATFDERFGFQAEVTCPVRGERWFARVDCTGMVDVYVLGLQASPVETTFWDWSSQTLGRAPGLPSTAGKALSRALAKTYAEKAQNRAEFVAAAKTQPQSAEPREARQGVLPLPLPSGFLPACPALEARAGASLGRSAELHLDVLGGSGERGPRTPSPLTSLPATDGVEREGCGDVASPFTPSWFAKEVVLVLAGVALLLLALAATRPEFSPLGVM